MPQPTLKRVLVPVTVVVLLALMLAIAYRTDSLRRARNASATPPAAPSDLTLRLVYRENSFLEGQNVTAVHGVREFTFQNTSKTKSITVEMPPTEIWMLTSNRTISSRTKLNKTHWPPFATNTASFTLAPGESRVFTAAFCMDIVKTGKLRNQFAPKLVFIFGPSNTKAEAREAVFDGMLVSESIWDDSNTSRVK
jgi:hypothetical protein